MINVSPKELAQIILSDLNTANVFPAGALVNAKYVHKELEPHLLADLSHAIEAVKRGEDPSRMSFFSLYLLNEFRTPELYPLLMKILRLNEPQLDRLIGDTLTEGIARMIAANFNGIADELWEIFDDQTLYEYARNAAVTGLLILVLHHKIAYEPTVAQVRARFVERMEAKHVKELTELMVFIMHTRMFELYDLVQEAFERNLIELFFYGDHECFEKRCALPRDLSYKHHNFIDGAFDELRWWSGMQTKMPIGLGGRLLLKPGRNDSCWCGSGMKYKKCCLKRKVEFKTLSLE